MAGIPKGTPRGTQASERVLVCDDDPQIRRALRVVLAQAGYEVLLTSTGAEALDLVDSAGPHVAIVDLVLPDVHGITLCAQLRSKSPMPIIVLSALGEEAIKIQALESGADDYVTKPFGPGELVARIQAVLRRAGRVQEPPRVELDGLVVDLQARLVWLDGEEVHLTPIEFSLLRVLAGNQGLVMTHRRLLVEVWGPEQAAATPLLRTHIGNLRAKLDGSGRTFIRTEAGIGYRFRAPKP
jgi:two-component system KDP operon response regulator KdpE